MAALPAFKHKLAASTVTLGLDSYTIPMTPSGTRILPTRIPESIVLTPSIAPTGSGNPATCSRLTIKLAILSALSSSRSSNAGANPVSAPAVTSCALAAKRLLRLSAIASRMANSALLRVATVLAATTREASRACRPSSFTLFSMDTVIPY